MLIRIGIIIYKYCILSRLNHYINIAIYSLLLRNKLFPQSFSSIRSLALRAVALELDRCLL
jgi:hypothetical protein